MTVSTISAELLIFWQPDLIGWYIIISWSILWKNWITVFKVKLTAKFQNVNKCLSRQHFLNHWHFYCQTWYGNASLWARLSFKKIGLLSSRSRSLLRITWLKKWLFNILYELLILLQVNLVWWHIIIRWIVLWKDWIALLWSRSRSQKRLRILVNVHLNDISSVAEPSVTQLGMVMQRNGPKYNATRLVSCLQVQHHSEGSFDQIWLFPPYLLNCWSFCKQT